MNLAIKGHKTRGKEVIALLEMLGGKNTINLHGECDNMIYIINSSYYGEIIYMLHKIDGYIVFSLEEFEGKYPYKVGDKVYNIIHNENQTITDLAWDSKENEVVYQTNNNEYVFVNYLQPYKEETIEEQKQIPPYMDYDIRTEENMEETIKIDIPKGYEFFGIDDDNKVVLTKKQFQYPKTYEECAKELGYNQVMPKDHILSYKGSLLSFFQQLLICRDAYWKISGEEMGLGKPWKPDYTNDDVKFCICCCANLVVDGITYDTNQVLTFPTEEMRDNFFENFKELIEECKELL